MHFLSCSIRKHSQAFAAFAAPAAPSSFSGAVSRVLPGCAPGEAASVQTLVACGRQLLPLSGADAHSGLELGPALQLYADPAARDGGPAAVRRPYQPTGSLTLVAWDPHSSAVYLRDGTAILRLTSDDTVTVVAGAAGEAGDADGRGGTARFRRPFVLASDGSGSLYLADGSRVRKLQLPGAVSGLGAAQRDEQPLAATSGDAGAGGAAAAAGNGDVVVSTLPYRAPARLLGVAFDRGSNGSGSLLLATATALYRLPLGGPDAVPLLVAGVEGDGSSVDGRGADARFGCITGIALDGEGSVYVADALSPSSTSLRRVAADGAVTTTVAGLEGYMVLPAILPNGHLLLSRPLDGHVHVLGLGLQLPAGHAATACTKPAAPAGPPPRTLPADLRALLDRQPDGTADVTIVVGGRTFHAHRALLSARSDYFQQRFGGGFADGSAQQLSLPDTDPDAFEVVLCWVYSGAVDIPAALAAGVAELADRLLLPGLREQAMAVVEASVSAVTVPGLLRWAEARGPAFSQLLSRLKSWYVDNHEAVMREAQEEMRQLAARSPDLFFQLVCDASIRPTKRHRAE